MKDKISNFWKRFKPVLKYFLLFVVVAAVVYTAWYYLHIWMYGEVEEDGVDWLFLFIFCLLARYSIKQEIDTYRGRKLQKDYVVFQKSALEDLIEGHKKKYQALLTIESNLKMMELIVDETIKNERNEPSNILKFGDVKSFATYVKSFIDINQNYLETQIKGENLYKSEETKHDQS